MKCESLVYDFVYQLVVI